MHLNPVSGAWKSGNSQLQHHVSLAIADSVWQYVETTADLDLLRYDGLELKVEIARFSPGAAGLSADLPVGRMHREARGARLYDGPDEVHRMVVARGPLDDLEGHAPWM